MDTKETITPKELKTKDMRVILYLFVDRVFDCLYNTNMLQKNSVELTISSTKKKLRDSSNRILSELKNETEGFKLSQRKIQDIFVEKIETEISKAVLEVLKKHPERFIQKDSLYLENEIDHFIQEVIKNL